MVVPHGAPNDHLVGPVKGGLGIFDAPNPWGPWTTVIYDDHWLGSNNIFYANIPTKWISGNDFYLVFTGIGSTDIAQDAYQHIKGTLVLKSIVKHHNNRLILFYPIYKIISITCRKLWTNASG